MRLLRLVSVLAGVVLAAAQCFGAASVHFALPVIYQSGNGANAVVSADVNGDGFSDLIVATNSGVSVLLNNGDGTFAAAVNYATDGPLSNSVAVADVNGDGIPDLVVTNMCLDTTTCKGVSVLLGVGDGTFLPAVNYDTGGLETGAVAVGDVNGDGAPDLILTSNCQDHTCADGWLTILLNQNDGKGTFGKPIEVLATKSGPVAVGDVNGDGKLDLVTGAGVLLGNGDGTFQAPIPDIPGGAVSIALADINGDGKLDAVVVDATGVWALLGNGDGTFQPGKHYPTGGVAPISVAVADFNGDGHPDLAVANECTHIVKGACTDSATVGVLAGNGDGTFKPAATFHAGGYLATSVFAADVNGDGKTDLLVTNACDGPLCANGVIGVLVNDFMATTVTKVVSSLNPAALGQTVTFTATVTSSSTIPDGSVVTFSDGGTTLGTAPTVSGVAVFTTSFNPPAGHHTITAAYGGDLYHKASSGTVTEIVNPYPSTVVLNSVINPTAYGQTATFTAVVTNPGGITPTGTVWFYNGSTGLGAVALDATGTATLNTAKLPVGVDNITANYGGDSSDAKSTSSVLMQTVNPAQLTMTLTSTPNPSKAKQTVTFTATLTSNGSLPTGTVTFSYNGATLGTGTLASGKAVFSTKALPSGSDLVTATFAGNSNYSSASASVTQTVN